MNRVVISGPGHHERAQYGSKITQALSRAGFEVTIEADLRPRLASDLALMIEAGAIVAVLHGSGIRAVVTHESSEDLRPKSTESKQVVVELVAGVSPIKVEIVQVDNNEDRATIMECI